MHTQRTVLESIGNTPLVELRSVVPKGRLASGFVRGRNVRADVGRWVSRPCLPHERIVMPLLFSYGTLQQEDVQLALFGRALAGHKDQLVGFELSLLRIEDPVFVRTSGKSHHAIVRSTGNAEDRVDGTVFEVTQHELERADEYEPAGYKRVAARLASGGHAWVYVDGRSAAETS